MAKPTGIEITVYRDQALELKPLINTLLNHGQIKFTYGSEFESEKIRYYLSFTVTGADWFDVIAQALPDYEAG